MKKTGWGVFEIWDKLLVKIVSEGVPATLYFDEMLTTSWNFCIYEKVSSKFLHIERELHVLSGTCPNTPAETAVLVREENHRVNIWKGWFILLPARQPNQMLQMTNSEI